MEEAELAEEAVVVVVEHIDQTLEPPMIGAAIVGHVTVVGAVHRLGQLRLQRRATARPR